VASCIVNGGEGGHAAAHPVGARIPVGYDPKDPSQALVLLDGPSGWFTTVSAASSNASGHTYLDGLDGNTPCP